MSVKIDTPPIGEIPNPASRLVRFAQQLAPRGQQTYFTDELHVGHQLYYRSQIHRDALLLTVLDNMRAYRHQFLPNGDLTYLDRSYHIPNALKLTGYLIGVAQTLYKPEDGQKEFLRTSAPDLDSQVPSSAQMLDHLKDESNGYIPIQSKLAFAVSLEDLEAAMRILITDEKQQTIYTQALRFAYIALTNNPPMDNPDGDGPQQPPRGGGGRGGGGDGPRYPRYPNSGCGCNSTQWGREEKERLAKHLERTDLPRRQHTPLHLLRR